MIKGKSNSKRKTLLGTKRNIIFSSFLLKFCTLGILSSLFFFDFGISKLHLLLFVALLNLVLLRKHCFKIVPFLLLSTFVISLIWWVTQTPIAVLSIQESLSVLFKIGDYHNALYTLWGCFLTGQIFLGTTSQYEINADLKRLHANIYIRLFVIVLFNSVAYFIETYKTIKRGLVFRLKKTKKISSVFYVFYTLMFDAVEIIVECKKAFWLNRERVLYSLSNDCFGNYCTETFSAVDNLVIEINDIHYADNQQSVIKDTNISLKRGVTLLVGANGSGKTTLLNGITKLIPEIINGVADINFITDSHHLCEKNIGYVMQGVESMFLYDTVEKALIHLPYEVALEGLQSFNMSYLLEGERPISELSAGECKVISLIGVLFDPKCSVVLLDEPTMFLAEPLKNVFFEILEKISLKKIVLASTHDLTMIHAFSTFYTLSKGTIVEGISRSLPFQELSKERQSDKCGGWHEIVEISQPILPRMYNSSRKSVDGTIELLLRSGMNLGIAGANGAGKTSLGICLCEEIKAKKNSSVVMLLQNLNKQFFTSSVLDELLFGLSKSEENVNRAKKYLEYMDISSLVSVPPQFISGGEKRLVLIGSLLMQNADIVVLDEPFDSLDDKHIERLIHLLCEHQKKTNCAYVFIDQSFETYENLLDTTLTVENFKIKQVKE